MDTYKNSRNGKWRSPEKERERKEKRDKIRGFAKQIAKMSDEQRRELVRDCGVPPRKGSNPCVRKPTDRGYYPPAKRKFEHDATLWRLRGQGL